MKKLLIVLFTVVAVGCFSIKSTHNVSAKDSNTVYHLRLVAMPKQGCDWKVELSNPDVVRYTAANNPGNNEDPILIGVYKDFYFIGLKEGTTDVKMEYFGSDGKVKLTNNFIISVDKSLNLTVKKNKTLN